MTTPKTTPTQTRSDMPLEQIILGIIGCLLAGAGVFVTASAFSSEPLSLSPDVDPVAATWGPPLLTIGGICLALFLAVGALRRK